MSTRRGLGALLAVPLLVGGAVGPLGGCGEQKQVMGSALDDRIVREEIRAGTGEEVGVGRFVEVHYTRFAPDGRVMLNTRDRGRAHHWVVGDRSTFVGLDRAVRGLRAGSVWNVVIPSELHTSYARTGGADDGGVGGRRRTGAGDRDGVVYRIEVVSVGEPPTVADAGGRVMPYSAPMVNPDARPSKFPLINATRGWGR
ncbi:MAG: FKBP-type peptidyl-prolyl cis-trans isomerase [Phycisphaerales bacterium]